MSPVEALLSVIPTLTQKEREQLTRTIHNTTPTPCERLGHNFKAAGKVLRWFSPPVVRMVCTRCGHAIER
jgi:hypothetical protein